MFLRRGPAGVAVASSGLFQRNLHTTVRRGKAHSQNLRSDLQSIARPSTIDREIGLDAQAGRVIHAPPLTAGFQVHTRREFPTVEREPIAVSSDWMAEAWWQ